MTWLSVECVTSHHLFGQRHGHGDRSRLLTLLMVVSASVFVPLTAGQQRPELPREGGVSVAVAGGDIPDLVARAGRVFRLDLSRHPVYGDLSRSVQVQAASQPSHEGHSRHQALPSWLHFNTSSRMLTGLALAPADLGPVLLTITSSATMSRENLSHDDHHHHLPSGGKDDVFQIRVVKHVFGERSFPLEAVRRDPSSPAHRRGPGEDTLTFSPSHAAYVGKGLNKDGGHVEFWSLPAGPTVRGEEGDSHQSKQGGGCEEVVVASLVVCASVPSLSVAERVSLLTRLAQFLGASESSLTLAPSDTRGLVAVTQGGFQLVSAGPGSDPTGGTGCSLSENAELMWPLSCSTRRHLADFARVLQHNVDGGRLQDELGGRPLMGWYVASSDSLATRRNRRRHRRGAGTGYRTPTPTPAIQPVTPTRVLSSQSEQVSLIRSEPLPILTSVAGSPTATATYTLATSLPSEQLTHSATVSGPDVTSKHVTHLLPSTQSLPSGVSTIETSPPPPTASPSATPPLLVTSSELVLTSEVAGTSQSESVAEKSVEYDRIQSSLEKSLSHSPVSVFTSGYDIKAVAVEPVRPTPSLFSTTGARKTSADLVRTGTEQYEPSPLSSLDFEITRPTVLVSDSASPYDSMGIYYPESSLTRSSIQEPTIVSSETIKPDFAPSYGFDQVSSATKSLEDSTTESSAAELGTSRLVSSRVILVEFPSKAIKSDSVEATPSASLDTSPTDSDSGALDTATAVSRKHVHSSIISTAISESDGVSSSTKLVAASSTLLSPSSVAGDSQFTATALSSSDFYPSDSTLSTEAEIDGVINLKTASSTLLRPSSVAVDSQFTATALSSADFYPGDATPSTISEAGGISSTTELLATSSTLLSPSIVAGDSQFTSKDSSSIDVQPSDTPHIVAEVDGVRSTIRLITSSGADKTPEVLFRSVTDQYEPSPLSSLYLEVTRPTILASDSASLYGSVDISTTESFMTRSSIQEATIGPSNTIKPDFASGQLSSVYNSRVDSAIEPSATALGTPRFVSSRVIIVEFPSKDTQSNSVEATPSVSLDTSPTHSDLDDLETATAVSRKPVHSSIRSSAISESDGSSRLMTASPPSPIPSRIAVNSQFTATELSSTDGYPSDTTSAIAQSGVSSTIKLEGTPSVALRPSSRGADSQILSSVMSTQPITSSSLSRGLSSQSGVLQARTTPTGSLISSAATTVLGDAASFSTTEILPGVSVSPTAVAELIPIILSESLHPRESPAIPPASVPMPSASLAPSIYGEISPSSAFPISDPPTLRHSRIISSTSEPYPLTPAVAPVSSERGSSPTLQVSVDQYTTTAITTSPPTASFVDTRSSQSVEGPELSSSQSTTQIQTAVLISTSVPSASTTTKALPSTTIAYTNTTTRTTTSTTTTTTTTTTTPQTAEEDTTRDWWLPVDTTQEPYVHVNRRPFLVHPIETIRAEQGRLLQFHIPDNVFYDMEDGDTSQLSLSLELPSRQDLPDNFWLYLEPRMQVLVGLPLYQDMDIQNSTIELVATDSQGLTARNRVMLQITDHTYGHFTHRFTLQFLLDFQHFMRDRRNITWLLGRVSEYFQDGPEARFITVLEVRHGSLLLSWSNSSLASDSACPKKKIQGLLRNMVRRDGSVRSSFNRHVGRHLRLMDVQFEPMGVCLPPPPTSARPTTTTQIVLEQIDDGLSIWAHVILPVLIAILVFFLLILVFVLCNRRRRERHRLEVADDVVEKEAISNDRNPIIFPEELDLAYTGNGGGDVTSVSFKPREPLVLPADCRPGGGDRGGRGSRGSCGRPERGHWSPPGEADSTRMLRNSDFCGGGSGSGRNSRASNSHSRGSSGGMAITPDVLEQVSPPGPDVAAFSTAEGRYGEEGDENAMHVYPTAGGAGEGGDNGQRQAGGERSKRKKRGGGRKRDAKDSRKKKREKDKGVSVSASSTLSWDRPEHHYLEEEAVNSRSSTLNSVKSGRAGGGASRAGGSGRSPPPRSPPPYWQTQGDPPPYRLPPSYITGNSTTQV